MPIKNCKGSPLCDDQVCRCASYATPIIKWKISSHDNLKPNGKKCLECGDGLTGGSRKYCIGKHCADNVYQRNLRAKKNQK